MSQEVNYDMLPDELAKSYLENSEHNAYFKDFFLGNPEDNAVPTDSLPAMFFIKTSGEYKQGATATDEVTHTILIRAIINRKSFIDEGSWDEAFDLKKLQLMVEGTINGTLDPNSILGILRSNFTLGGWLVNNEITTEYGGVRDIFANEVTRECQIKMTLTRLQLSLKT